jgi:ornithine--oxo-acid transaminase
MALKVLVEEGMVENAAVQGARMMAGLADIGGGAIKEVRGRGLMIAVELHLDAGGARRYCEALQARGLLCKETHNHTIRIAPPLVVTGGEVDWALEQFEAVLG